jgi:hypothetical protein
MDDTPRTLSRRVLDPYLFCNLAEVSETMYWWVIDNEVAS